MKRIPVIYGMYRQEGYLVSFLADPLNGAFMAVVVSMSGRISVEAMDDVTVQMGIWEEP